MGTDYSQDLTMNKMGLSSRDHVIDFTKGFLVITMVAYHTLNYYLLGYHPLYAYVGYVSLAFIFYSGFMCGTIYFQRFIVNKKAVYRRLTVRGLKLIVLFIIVNVIIHVIPKNYHGLSLFFNDILSIFLTGDNRIARFAILLPIGYLLLISSLLINLHKYKYFLYAILVTILLLASIYKISLSFNIICVLIGIGGLLSGLINNELLSKIFCTSMRYTGFALLLLFLFILLPLIIDTRIYYVMYFLYINVVIYNLHLVGSFLDPSKLITRNIIKFGEYSLFLYLVQIFILQALKRVFDFRISSVTMDHFLIFVFVNILLVGVCYLTDYLKRTFILVNKIYRFVFS